MKQYTKPEINISVFMEEDILTSSGGIQQTVNGKTEGNYKTVKAEEIFSDLRFVP